MLQGGRRKFPKLKSIIFNLLMFLLFSISHPMQWQLVCQVEKKREREDEEELFQLRSNCKAEKRILHHSSSVVCEFLTLERSV